MSEVSLARTSNVPCPMCGERASRPTMLMRNEPWACSPCRAEATGTVYLRLPPFASPSTVGALFGNGETALDSLRRWAQGLSTAAAKVTDVCDELVWTPDAEAVAHAVMGEDPALGLRVPTHEGHSLVLEDLPGATARRLAKECAMADGPDLSGTDIERLFGMEWKRGKL